MPQPSTKEVSSHKECSSLSDETAGLRLLLRITADCREAKDLRELQMIMANETRKLIKARQVYVFFKHRQMRLHAISGLAKLNMSAPLVQDVQSLIRKLENRRSLSVAGKSTFNDLADIDTNFLSNCPFHNFYWLPLKTRDDDLIGGLLLAREEHWHEVDDNVANHLAEIYAYSMALMLAEPSLKWKRSLNRMIRGRPALLVGSCLFFAAMFIPIQMSAIAPVEISAQRPFIVAAPFEGMIEEILVEPSEEVRENQILVRLSNSVLRNKLEVAKEEVQIAEARLNKVNHLAFVSKEGQHSLRVAMADLKLKQAKLRFAREMYERAEIKAERDGVAIFANKQALLGKPVQVGDRIMQIADPAFIEVRIDMPVGDALLLERGASARVFLDSDPLNARDARIEYSDYKAHQTAAGLMAFRATANFIDEAAHHPRIGVRGTAQVFGEETVLGIFLFRRPLAALRQWIGL